MRLLEIEDTHRLRVLKVGRPKAACILNFDLLCRGCASYSVQRYLAHEEARPPRTLHVQ